MNDQTKIDQQVLGLLNRAIDGELNESEKGELIHLLTDSTAVCELNAELRAVVDMLDELPVLDPPDHLQNAIISQVRLPLASQVRTEKPPGDKGFFSTWLASHWWQAGLSVAAGVLLMVGVFQYELVSLPQDSSNMTGTMVKTPASVKAGLLDSTRFDTEIFSANAELLQEDGFLRLDIQVDSQTTVLVNVDFARGGLEYIGVTGLESQSEDISVVNGSVNITSTGQQHYSLLLRPSVPVTGTIVAQVLLGFYTDDTLVHEASLGGSQLR